MAVDSQYTDSESDFKLNNQDNWQSLGDLASRLAEKAEFLKIEESLIDYDDEAAQ